MLTSLSCLTTGLTATMLGLAVAVKKVLCLSHNSTPTLTSNVALKGKKSHVFLTSPRLPCILFITLLNFILFLFVRLLHAVICVSAVQERR